MKRAGWMAVVVMGLASSGLAAETWTGVIGDSKCGKTHKSDKDMGGGSAKAKNVDRDCVLACTSTGAKFVFVNGSEVYKIANQDFADLKEYAGQQVKLTGEVSGDTVTVSHLEMVSKPGSATR